MKTDYLELWEKYRDWIVVVSVILIAVLVLNHQNEMDKRVPYSKINTSLDVLSTEFMYEYFSGAEPYIFEGIEDGMSQAEIEEILGLPDDYYDVEGGEYAIYDNLAILYSQSYQSQSGLDKTQNYITRTEVFLGFPHEEIVAAYGRPTLRYDEYPDLGPGRKQTIYDDLKNDGYAIYIDVGTSGTAWLMTKGEESPLVEEYK